MRKGSLIIAGIFVLTIVLAAMGVYAGTTVKDVIELNEPSYAHEKGIIQFAHKKHAAEYGATCGECHHDDKGKPLELKEGDNVQRCIECHKKPGEAPKGKDKPKLSKEQKLEYHAEALHDNCKGCHKDYNKKNKTKKAPTTCAKCHPKTN